jgi:hypothetical protein
MNIKPLPIFPRFSNIVVNLKGSLLKIEMLMNLRPKFQTKLYPVRLTPVSRWNE